MHGTTVKKNVGWCLSVTVAVQEHHLVAVSLEVWGIQRPNGSTHSMDGLYTVELG